MNQINTDILKDYTFAKDPNQLQQESLSLQQMALNNRVANQKLIDSAQKAKESSAQNALIQQGAAQELSPMQMISKGVNPEYMKEYAQVYNKNQEWADKQKGNLEKHAKETLAYQAADATDLNPNDPNSANIWIERQKIRGLDTNGFNVTPEFLTGLQGIAFTSQEKITNKLEGRKVDVSEMGASTNAKNAETQAKNQALAEKRFQAELNKPPKPGDTPESGKPLSSDAAKTIGLISSGLQGAATLSKALREGDPTFWATTMLGGFTNPKASIAFNKAVESLGRLNSGGAITDDEIKNFKRLVADKKSLMTPEGRAAIADELDNYINRGKATGNAIYGGESWQTKFGVPKNTAQEKVKIPKIKSDEDYDKLQSGQQFVDPYGKIRRKP